MREKRFLCVGFYCAGNERKFSFFPTFASHTSNPPSRNFPSLQNISRGRPKEERKKAKSLDLLSLLFLPRMLSSCRMITNFRGGNSKAGLFSWGGGGESSSTSQKDHINYNAVDVCVGWKFHLVKCDENRIGINMWWRRFVIISMSTLRRKK